MTKALTALGLVLAMGSAVAAQTMSADDRKIIDSCIMMIDDFMMKDKACTEAMKRTNLAQADMTVMRNCRKMPAQDVDRDKQCVTMREKYPDLMVAGGSADTSNAGGTSDAARR